MSNNEPVQHVRLLTIFDVLQGMGASTGLAAVSMLGYQTFGWPAAVVAAPFGFIAGAYIGNLPWFITDRLIRYEIRRSSADQLKQRLANEYYFSHLLIAELVSRGEPLEQFRDYVTGLMRSDDPHQRYRGHDLAHIWFPDALPSQPGPSNPTGPAA